MNEQLSLFKEIGTEFFRVGAEKLLDAVNEGRKQRDMFKIQYYYKHKNFFVLMASDREKNVIFNCVDENGNIPPDFDVCWRAHQFILDELNIELV